MEQRGQGKDIGLPYSMGYNPQTYNNESSNEVPLVPVVSNLEDRRIRNEASRASSIPSSSQTLDQHQQQQQQQNPPPPPPPLRLITNEEDDLNPDPDPAQVANATIPSASNSKTAAPQPQPQAPSPVGNNISSSIRYRECLKNHAASMGGYVIDGCGEFMPSGEEGTPEALRCAACDCHRNFHRKEGDAAEAQAGTSSYHTHTHNRHNNTSVFRSQAQTTLITMTPHHHHHHQQQQQQHKLSRTHGLPSPTGHMAPMMMAFGGNSGAAAESSSEDLNMFQYNAGAQTVQPSFSVSKKRFRTKFTQQQKDRMNEFAEKLGWKIQKQDEQQVQQFCNEVGLKRQVFKVWMHNNKQAMKKKDM